MKALPSLTVMIITYNRRDDIFNTVMALHNNLYYDGLLNLVIADDNTPDPTYEDFCHNNFYELFDGYYRFFSTGKNSGWGANANNSLIHVKDDIILFLEDDYVLTKELDISPFVALMLAHESIGLVRLDGISGHKMVCHCTETDIADYMPHYRQGIGMPGKLNYFLLDNSSRELWLYSNRPHLKHRRFHNFYGMYPEGLRLGATEESFAHHVKDMMTLPDAPAIAIPLDATSYFDHVGKSFQFSEFDKEHNVAK